MCLFALALRSDREMVNGARREVQIMLHVSGHSNIVELVVRSLLSLLSSSLLNAASCPLLSNSTSQRRPLSPAFVPSGIIFVPPC